MDSSVKHRWINDEIVNGFLQMARNLDFDICSESKKQRSFFGPLAICKYLDTLSEADFAIKAKPYIYSALCGETNVKWTNIYDMPTRRFFFVHCLGGDHYICLLFYPDMNLIILYNPFLNQSGYHLAAKLRDWLFTEQKRKQQLEGIETLISPCDIECREKPFPLQINGYDCGIFILASLLCQITETPEIFSQTDMSNLRLLMAESFAEKKIDVSNFKIISMTLMIFCYLRFKNTGIKFTTLKSNVF